MIVSLIACKLQFNDATRLHLMAVVFLSCWAAVANIQPAFPISSNMVLQRQMPVRIWGTGSGGGTVTVSFAGQTASAPKSSDGSWEVWLPAMEASSLGREMTIADEDTSFVLSNILVGEVWLGGGQSNMARSLAVPDDIAQMRKENGPYPTIRLMETTSTNRGPKQWWEAGEGGGFSTLLFFFGERLSRELDVPIGLINAAYQSKSAAYFMKAGMFDDYNTFLREQFVQDSITSESQGTPLPASPSYIDVSDEISDGEGWTTIVEPAIHYTVRGVFWDQGENGTGIGGSWHSVMGALYRGWRKEAGQPLPFIVTQKKNGGGCAFSTPTGTLWPQAYGDTLAPLPESSAQPQSGKNYPGRYRYYQARLHDNVLMYPVADFDDGDHPMDKPSYAYRAARYALSFVYGINSRFLPPEYAGHQIEGNSMRVFIANTSGALLAGQSSTVQGFAIAGADGVFYWADATIEDSTVVLSSPSVSTPVVATYAFSDSRPWANLFTSDSVPVPLFITGEEPAQYTQVFRCSAKHDAGWMGIHIFRTAQGVFLEYDRRADLAMGSLIRVFSLNGACVWQTAFRHDTQKRIPLPRLGPGSYVISTESIGRAQYQPIILW